MHLRGEGAEQGWVLERFNQVALNCWKSAAARDQKPGRRSTGNPDEERHQRRNRLPATDSPSPSTDTNIAGLDDGTNLLRRQRELIKQAHSLSSTGSANSDAAYNDFNPSATPSSIDFASSA